MVRPERIKLAAVLAAVKARPLGVLERDKLCVSAGLDGVCARAAAVIRGRGEGRACGAVEQENVTKRIGASGGSARSAVDLPGECRPPASVHVQTVGFGPELSWR
jgi:hypothetical protein